MTELVIALASSVLLGVVWGVRQEGRISTLDLKVDANEKLQIVKSDGLEKLINERFDDQSERLNRIERAMNGYLRGGGHA